MTMNTALNTALTRSTTRTACFSEQAEVLGEIYQPECNLAVWQRYLHADISSYVDALKTSERLVNLKCLVDTDETMLEETQTQLKRALPDLPGRDELIRNVCELVDMYHCLFEPKQIGMRLATLKKAMCPKFHVDYIPARMVTSYSGEGTHWLPEPSDESPRIPKEEPQQYNQLTTGDVALLKGDGWFENEGFGIVHRSPPVAEGDSRMFLSLDFAD